MRRRIVFFALGTALLAVAVLAVPLGLLAGRGYVRDERLELQQAATRLASSLRGEITNTPRPADPEVQVGVYDRTGRRVSGDGPMVGGSLVATALRGGDDARTTANTVAVAVPVSDGDQVTGALLVTSSLDAAHRRTRQAWLVLIAMGVGAVALAGLGAAVLARRLTGPIDRLIAVARRVGRGDLEARVAPSGVPEIDTLGMTLNETVGRLEGMVIRERAFSAEVSHQLRTSLTDLRLRVEQASGQADLSSTLAAVDRLETTIADVIGLARNLPAPSNAPVAELMAGVVARWHGPLAAASRRLDVVVEPSAPATLGISRAAGDQILNILVDNAYRHGRGTVTVRVRHQSSATAVDVSDEGRGLQLEAWQLFQRPPTNIDHGIGLPYARRLAEAEESRLVLTSSAPPVFSLITPN